MIQELSGTLSQACHMLGLIVILLGALQLLGAIFANSGPLGYVKGGALILVGTWFAGIFS